MARPLIDGIRRNGRMNFAFVPKLKTSLEKLARINEVTTSRLVESILQTYVNEREDDIEEYDKLIAKLQHQKAFL